MENFLKGNPDFLESAGEVEGEPRSCINKGPFETNLCLPRMEGYCDSFGLPRQLKQFVQQNDYQPRLPTPSTSQAALLPIATPQPAQTPKGHSPQPTAMNLPTDIHHTSI